jgi:hypothetical protein
MNATERTSISESIHLIFEWIRRRKPGPGTLDWLVADPPAPIVLDLSFPDMKLTEEEDNFLPENERLYAINGHTPGTLRPIDRALTRLTPIGGELTLEKLGDGMSVRIAIPASVGDDADAKSKIELIQEEIRRELTAPDEGGSIES